MVRERLRDAASEISNRVRASVQRTYRDRYDDVNPNEIVADAVVAIIFTGLGIYGLSATLTTPTTTLPGRLGALGVVGIEAMMVYFGVMHGAATWNIYRRSEVRYRYCESVDGYVVAQNEED
ncbi:MAG: hypothetical protein ABEJ68_08440 [Halobacteriaceae archaeon]